MITLYSTHCPRCKVLEMKLAQKGIEYTLVDDKDQVLAKAKEVGLSSAPFMDIDGQICDFTAAVKAINER